MRTVEYALVSLISIGLAYAVATMAAHAITATFQQATAVIQTAG